MVATSATVALLTTTAIGAAPAWALTPGAATTATTADTTPKAAEDKFTPTALQELTDERSADFWIKMADEADTSAARTIANWNERGQYVVDTLKAAAEASQAETIADLERAGVDYKAYWISNRILVRDGNLALATDLAANPEVEEIHETVMVEKPDPAKEAAPTDMEPTAVEWGVEEIGAPQAWAMGVTGAGITVSSVDSGTQYDHPALVNQYRGNNGDGTFTHDYNWFDTSGRCSGVPCDSAANYSHGTHTMGTMVGDDGGDNQIGVAPDANWIEANGCDTCSDVDLIEAGEWIANPTDLNGDNPDVSKRPHIVNNSWGATAAGVIDDWYNDITTAWADAGIFGVWAAGNSGPSCQTTSSPGANTDNYSVGNYASNGVINSLSSRGPGEDGLIKPNISAPGTSVRSAIVNSDYGLLSGTSMAAPHVAGAVALLWSYSPVLIGDIEATKELLNTTARDTDDTTCGGTPENNNIYGEGKVDVMALLEAAPSQGIGTIAGTVTDTSGTPIVGASVTATSDDLTRTASTDEAGAFTFPLTEGEYTVTVTAYGYLDATSQATITADETTTVDFALESASLFAVSGTVSDGTAPVAGATVTIAPQIEPAVTGDDGTFSFPSVPAGTYTLTATAGMCVSDATQEVVVDGDENVDVTLGLREDSFGYTCTESEASYLQGDTLVPLSGLDVWTTVPLPFEFPLYGEHYDTAYVSSKGHINFLAGTASYANHSIPNAAIPNAALYAYWDDLNLDAEAALYSGTTTIDGQEAFTLEWRNVARYGASTDRLNFSATMLADGTVIYGYGSVADTDSAKGDSATVGVENATGTIAYEYSFNTAFVHEGLTITFDAPPMGTVEGRIRDYNTKENIEGATVTAVDADGNETSVQTGADGTYTMPLVLDRYDITIEADDYETATRTVNLDEEDEVLVRNAQLNAGRLEVSRTEMEATLAMGGSASRTVRVTNTGSAPVDVQMSPSETGFEILGGNGSAGVIKHVIGEATVPKSATPKGTAADPGAKESFDPARAKVTAGTPTRVTPEPTAAAAGEVVMTHSSSQDIVRFNSVACNGGPTQILRTFTLSDFGITSGLNVTAVEFGVEANIIAQDITVNLYSLTGDLQYSNMELVGSTVTNLPTQEMTMVSVPVEGSVPAGGTLVAEIRNEIGSSFYIGSNPAPETAPTYLASDFCNTPEPADTATIGYPDMNAVINVHGETAGGGDATWLEVQPPSFTLNPGQSVAAVATMNAAVDQPGTYTGEIAVNAATPYAEPSVTATMTVRQPAGWGKITGVVTGDGSPIEGAVVHLDGLAYDVTLLTDSEGSYSYWVQKANAPLTVNVSAPGFVPQSKTAQIIVGQTTVYNFDLKSL